VQAYRRGVSYSWQVSHDDSASDVFIRWYRSPDDRVNPIGDVERRVGDYTAGAANRASDVIAPYIRFKKIPQFFDYLGEQTTPPQTQAEILGNYISKNMPQAKIAILRQADAVGSQFLSSFYAGLGMEPSRSGITNMDEIHAAEGNRVARVSGSNSDVLAIFGRADSELELLREMTKFKWRPLLVMMMRCLTWS
jgi:hypothetical protein